VSRAWPDRVRIDVTERRVVAVVAPTGVGERFRGTDADGVVFRSYARRPTGLPLIRMLDQTGAAALAEAAAVSGSLPAGIAKRVAEVRVRTVDTITLSLRDGRTVRWGSVDGSADKARVLAVLLRQQASFIDVSVPGRPVIRR
jgi:cell division protein FtsQ